MEAFPFSKDEWQAVRDAALRVLNASMADDTLTRASHFLEFQQVLVDLKKRHGNHPVLLETEADFTEDTAGAICLYRQARDAAANDLSS